MKYYRTIKDTEHKVMHCEPAFTLPKNALVKTYNVNDEYVQLFPVDPKSKIVMKSEYVILRTDSIEEVLVEITDPTLLKLLCEGN